MQLLITYDDRSEAETAVQKLKGAKRLASDRDDNEVIYNLFGEPTWANFYTLGMYSLPELKEILAKRTAGQSYDKERHESIVTALGFVVTNYGLSIPSRWSLDGC